MADNVNLPLTGSGDATALCSTEEVTTLNGGAVSAQHVQRVVIAARTADGTAVDVGKAEDAASATGDALIPIAAKRSDTPAATSGTDGDYEPLQVAGGRLWTSATVDAALPAGTNAIGKLAANSGVDIGDVDVTSVPAPLSTTGGGTEATALRVTVANDSTGVLSVDDNGGSLTVDGTVTATIAAGATTIAKAEDVASADADVGVPAMAVRKATPANTSGTDGDYEMLQMSAGRLWTSATVDAALPAGTNAIGKLAANNGVDIGDVDVTSIVPGTGATNLGKAEDAAHTTGDVGVMALSVRQDTAAALGGTDADYQPLITDASGRLHVINSGGVGGTVAHDAADSGNPLKVGGKARTTNPTAVADADRVDATFDDLGRQVVVLNQVRDLVGHQHTQIASSAAETTIVTTVASTLLDLVGLVITNQTATAVNVTIKDGTGGTTRMILALAASGGIVLNFPVPVTQSAAGNWTATLSSASVTVNIFAQFVKNV